MDSCDSIVIFVDDDSSGYDGVAIARDVDAYRTSYEFFSGILPAGIYYLYAGIERKLDDSSVMISQSAYIGPLRINSKPLLRFNSPSFKSGGEYFRDELGSSWERGELYDSLPASGISLDVSFGRPYDTSYYRYFCYSLGLGPASNSSGLGASLALSFARTLSPELYLRTRPFELVESAEELASSGDVSVDYCLDLLDSSNFDSDFTWRDLDMGDEIILEFSSGDPARELFLSSLGLYSQNRSSSSKLFDIEWVLEDSEGEDVEIRLYYDVDDEGFNGEEIAVLAGQRPGLFIWAALYQAQRPSGGDRWEDALLQIRGLV